MSGKLITFEGLDGSGKTTVIHNVIQYFKEINFDKNVIFSREPGGDRISEAIRNIILNEKYTEMDVRTEALLYAAARRQHLVEVVFPALDDDKIVLSDRFVDSSLAYQGAGREIGMQAIGEINRFATNGLKPDLTIYFEITPEVGLSRIHQGREFEINRLDREKNDFYQRVHEGYLKLAHDDPQRIITIDATQSIEKVTEDVLKVLTNFLNIVE